MSIVLLLLSLSATTGSCNDAVACATDAVADGDDDRCQLLQSGVGVISQHVEDNHEQLVHGKHQAETTAQGFPDILKGITSALGGVEELEKDFEAMKTAVGTFVKETHTAITSLADSTKAAKASMSMETAQVQVKQAYTDLHAAAVKLYQALSKASSSFTQSGAMKLVPTSFKSAMTKVLGEISTEAKHFADSFSHAADGFNAKLKTVKNHTLVCDTVKSDLDYVNKKVEKLSSTASGLSTKGMNKDLLAAKDALPKQIKEQVDKILHKANDAAESLISSLSSTVQDLSHNIAKAFEGHCTGLQSSAGRLEVGLASALVIVALHLYM